MNASRGLTECMNAVLGSGVSVIPINSDTKRPYSRILPKDRETGEATWAPYMTAMVDPHTLRMWQEQGIQAFAVVCGEVSGGLLVLDFDVARFYEAWCEAVGDLADGLPVQMTGGGGYQVMLRCDKPGRNCKLAWEKNEQKQTGRIVAIETRGEGGYAVLAPSLHPTGNYYEILSGDFAAIPKVSQAKADALLLAAENLDECPLEKQHQELAEKAIKRREQKRKTMQVEGSSVIDAYNEANGIIEELQSHGYQKCGRSRMIRPEAEKDSEPGVVFFERGSIQISFHHSTNDPLNNGHAHDAFDVFCYFAHGGNVTAAVREAAEKMGMTKKKTTVDEIKKVLESPPESPAEPVQESERSTPAIELGVLMSGIVSGEIYAVPFSQPVITRMTCALLPGCTTCVTGDPGVGKTFWILDNLQFWMTNGYKPAALFLEKSRRFYMHRLLAMLEGKGCYIDYDWIKLNHGKISDAMERNRGVLDFVGACFDGPQKSRMSMAQVTQWAITKARAGHRVLIVDPITAASAGEKRWNDDDEFVLGCENELEKHGTSLIVITHSKKGNRPGSPTMHDMALGAAFQRFADTNIWIYKPKKPRKVRIQGPCGLTTAKFNYFFQIHKARNGRGAGVELAYSFTEGLRFTEQGIVQADVAEHEDEEEAA